MNLAATAEISLLHGHGKGYGALLKTKLNLVMERRPRA